MPRVQLSVSEDERVRFGRQARKEGKSLGAWLREAAHDKLKEHEEAERPPNAKRYWTVEEFDEFFRKCDARHGPNPEPELDWEEHLRVMEASKSQGIIIT